MKVKNVVFSGFMAAILMSATGTASAAISVASQGYVDAKVGAVETSVSDTYQTKADAATALAGKADNADTLAGYGITDAYTKTESDEKFMILEDATVLGANLQWTSDGKLDTKGIATEAGVAALQERVNGTADTAGTVAYDIAAALKAANDYTDTEVKELAEGTVATNTANIATNTADIATLKTNKANVSDVYTKGDVDQKLADYTKTTELDAGFVSESEMTTFKSENANAIATAKQAGDDAQATANANKQAIENETTGLAAAHTAISQLETDLANKISAPAACEKQDCVLSINKASGTISWVPLTEPVEDFIGK